MSRDFILRPITLPGTINAFTSPFCIATFLIRFENSQCETLAIRQPNEERRCGEFGWP